MSKNKLHLSDLEITILKEMVAERYHSNTKKNSISFITKLFNTIWKRKK